MLTDRSPCTIDYERELSAHMTQVEAVRTELIARGESVAVYDGRLVDVLQWRDQPEMRNSVLEGANQLVEEMTDQLASFAPPPSEKAIDDFDRQVRYLRATIEFLGPELESREVSLDLYERRETEIISRMNEEGMQEWVLKSLNLIIDDMKRVLAMVQVMRRLTVSIERFESKMSTFGGGVVPGKNTEGLQARLLLEATDMAQETISDARRYMAGTTAIIADADGDLYEAEEKVQTAYRLVLSILALQQQFEAGKLVGIPSGAVN